MFHAFAALATVLPQAHMGGKVVTVPSFEANQLLRLIEVHRPTFMNLVPPLVSWYAEADEVKTRHVQDLRFVFVAAAPVGETLANKFWEKAPNCLFREGKSTLTM